MTTTLVPPLRSLNEASESDPSNNNCYGTLVDQPYRMVSLPVLNVEKFNECVVRGSEEGTADGSLPADAEIARSLVPAGTASLRDFSYISPETPEYIPDNGADCMGCVT